MCGDEMESSDHFLLFCNNYVEERGKLTKLQQPYEENKERIIGRLLFDLTEDKEVDEVKEFLQILWKKREGKVKQQ